MSARLPVQKFLGFCSSGLPVQTLARIDAFELWLAERRAGLREEDCQGIVLAGCWAHVYRKFEDAAPDHPEANLALDSMGKLYDIDARADGDLERLAALRRTESVEILENVKAWLWTQAPLKTLSIGNASAYTVTNWERLTRFVSGARIQLDNNTTERGIRGPVVGRRDHFGSKSKRDRCDFLHRARDVEARGCRPGDVSPRSGTRERSRRGAAARRSGCAD